MYAGGGYSSSSKSFLINILSLGTPTRYPIVRNYNNAVYRSNDYGPTFGGGHDLFYGGKDNMYINPWNYLKIGRQKLNGIKCSEVEVFYKLN